MRRALIIFLLSFVLIGAVYRKTPINFLRAESGWFLFHAYSAPDIQRHFQTGFFLTSYAGHYTPLAFAAEFQMAKIAGTNDSIWKWRQILALAVIGAGLAGTVYAIAGAFQLPASLRWMMATAVSATSVFAPQIMEFIGWPFMILQLAVIGLLILSLYGALRVAVSPEERRWPWVAALAAYGSMHATGLGLIAVIAVSIVFAAILLVAVRCPSSIYQPSRKRIAAALTTMLGLAVVHGGAMLYLLPAPPSLVASAGSFCKLILGFTANLAMTALQTFIDVPISEPNARSIAYSWPYGLLIVGGALVLLRSLLAKSLREPTPRHLTRFALHAFSISAFFAMVGLIAARLFQCRSLDAAAATLAFCITTPRYIVPLHFLMVASVVDVFVRMAERAPRFSSGLFSALTLAAIAAQVDYRANTFPYVAPLARISHRSAWGLIVATVRECRAAKLPVPNVPLAALTQEFSDWDPAMFQPLLRRELQLRPEEKIELIPWAEYLQGGRDRYREVPSLQLLERKLNLERD